MLLFVVLVVDESASFVLSSSPLDGDGVDEDDDDEDEDDAKGGGDAIARLL